MGLKPTLGEVSCAGAVPLSPSLDHVGPLARTVEDARLIYRVIRGEPSDRTHPATPRDARTLRLGLPHPYLLEVLDDEVRRVFEATLGRLQRVGVAFADVAVPHAGDVPAIYLHLQLPEASAYHATAVEARPEDYAPSVRTRLELGRYVLAEDYARAQRGREILAREVDEALAGVDALALPTLPIEPPSIGARSQTIGGHTFPVRGLMLRLTQLFNLSGHPAMSLPCGWTERGLPCGLQLAGRRGQTEDLLAVAACCESHLGCRAGPGIPGGGSG